jgi:hypothetical protein
MFLQPPGSDRQFLKFVSPNHSPGLVYADQWESRNGLERTKKNLPNCDGYKSQLS